MGGARLMAQEWTEEQKRQIVANYRRDGYTRCPNDGRELDIIRHPTNDAQRDVLVRCRSCGQEFFASDIGLG